MSGPHGAVCSRMDPIAAQLGRNAYHALCVAFAAQNKDRLYVADVDVLVEEARLMLGVTEDEDSAIREEIEQDPVIAALRLGEMPPGGLQALEQPPIRAAAPFGGGHGGMPPPGTTTPSGLGGGYDTPFGNSVQQKAAAKKPSATPTSAGASSSSLIGRKLQRLFPDLSPPWVTGTITAFNATNGKHLIQYGPPLRKELWDKVEDFPPQNFRWVEPGSEPAGGGGGSKTTPKSGGGSKSTPKASASKAPPPQPLPKAPAAVPVAVAAPHGLLPGGASTFHATGVSLTSAPYNDGFLRASIAKNRPEDLFTMLSAMDDREATVVRELVTMLDDPEDIADINRLMDESQQLGQREQQLRAELRELGVMG